MALDPNEWEVVDESSQLQTGLDPNEWEVVPEDVPSSESRLSRLGKAAYNAFEGATSDVELGGLRLADYLSDSVPGLSNSLGLDRLIQIRQEQDRKRTEELIDPESTLGTASQIARGALPMIGAFLATGNPQIAASVPATLSGLNKYEEGRNLPEGDAGYLPSAIAGITQGGADYLLNRLEISPLSRVSGSPIGRVLGATGLGAVGSAGSAATSLGLDAAVYDQQIPLDEAGRIVGESSRLGALGGGITGGVIETARGLGARTLSTIDNDPEIKAIEEKLVTPLKTPPQEAPGTPQVESPLVVDNPIETTAPTQPEVSKQISDLNQTSPKALDVETKSDFKSPVEVVRANQSPETSIAVTEKVSDTDPATKVITLADPEFQARDDAVKASVEDLKVVASESKRRNPQSGALSLDPLKWFLGKDGDASFVPPSEDYADFGRTTIRKILTSFRNTRRNLELYENDVRPIYDGIYSGAEIYATTARESLQGVQPYFDLPEQSRVKVGKTLRALRNVSENGQLADFTDEKLTFAGLSPQEVSGAKSLMNTFDVQLTKFEDAAVTHILNRRLPNGEFYSAKTNKTAVAKVKQMVAGLRGKFYFPNSRFGDWAIVAKDEKGNLLSYMMRESKGEARAAVSEVRKLHPGADVKYMEIEPTPKYIADRLPAEMRGFLSFLDEDVQGQISEGSRKAPTDVRKHFLKAKLIEGADTNYDRTVLQYLDSMAQFYARAKADPQVESALVKLKETKPYLHAEMQQLVDDARSPRNKLFQKATKALSDYMIVGNIGTLISNGLEPLVNTYPQISNYLKGFKNIGQSEVIAVKSAANQMGYVVAKLQELVTGENVFAKAHPELNAAIEKAREVGFLDDAWISKLKAGADGESSITSVSDVVKNPLQAATSPFQTLALANSGVESGVRFFSFITGVNVGKRLGLKGDALTKFAIDFTRDVKYIPSTIEKNFVLRKAPILGTMRGYIPHQLRLLNRATRNAFKGNPGQLARALAVIGAVGGIMGVPFGKQAASIFTRQGEDPRQVARRILPEQAADAVNYGGISALTGTNLASVASYEGIIPSLEQGGISATAQFLLGPWAGIMMRPFQVWELSKRGLGVQAAEKALPAVARPFIRAYRYATEGVVTPYGDTIIPREAVSPELLAKTAIGLNDLNITKAYELSGQIKTMNKSSQDESQEWNTQMKVAAAKRDFQKMRELLGNEVGQRKIATDPRFLSNLVKTIGKSKNFEGRLLNNVPKYKREKAKEILNRYKGTLGEIR